MIHKRKQKLNRLQQRKANSRKAASRRKSCKSPNKLYKHMADIISQATGANKKIISSLILTGSKYHLFESLTDPRDSNKIKYKFSDLIILAFMAVCKEGSCSFESMSDHILVNHDFYEKQGLIRRGKIPSHDVFRTLFMILDPSEFREVTTDALQGMLSSFSSFDQSRAAHILQIDGKEIRGTGRSRSSKNPRRNTNVLNVYDFNTQVCIKSIPVDSKTNEIPEARRALLDVNIQGCYVTADALHCQNETCEFIKWKKGFYVFPIKDKRRLAYKQVIEIFENPRLSRGRKTIETTERTFEYYKLSGSRKIEDIPTVKTVIKMTSRVRKNEEPAVMYFISNSTNIEHIIESIESRWDVENGHHKLKDSSLIREDEVRFQEENALRNLTILTNLIATLTKLVQILKPGMRLAVAKKAVRAFPLEALQLAYAMMGDENFQIFMKNGIRKETSREDLLPAPSEAG